MTGSANSRFHVKLTPRAAPAHHRLMRKVHEPAQISSVQYSLCMQGHGGLMVDYLVLGIAAFGAGLVDAVVGGGGLVQLPAMFAVFPNMAPATLIGTNKLASIFGTSVAAVSYARRVAIAWSVATPAALAALVFAFLGAYTVTKVSAEFMRLLLPVVLVAVAIYTFAKK